MTTTPSTNASVRLTREARDRAAAALRRAHAERRPMAKGVPLQMATDGTLRVCSCVIIAEEFGFEISDEDRAEVARRARRAGARVYEVVDALGIDTHNVFYRNDRTTWTFSDVAEWVAALDVVDEAEAICRDAAELVTS